MMKKFKEWAGTLLAYLGVPLTLLLLPIMFMLGWPFKKGMNVFEAMERAAALGMLCGWITLLSLASLLYFLI